MSCNPAHYRNSTILHTERDTYDVQVELIEKTPQAENLPLTYFDKFLNIILIFIHLFSWLFIGHTLKYLPEMVNTYCDKHSMTKNQESCMDSKYKLLISPIITSILAILIHFTTYSPHKVRIPCTSWMTMTPENSARIYTLTRIYIRVINILFSLVFMGVSIFLVNQSEEGINISDN